MSLFNVLIYVLIVLLLLKQIKEYCKLHIFNSNKIDIQVIPLRSYIYFKIAGHHSLLVAA